MKQYLAETPYINFSDAEIQKAAIEHSSPERTDKENAISLYYFVRDQIRYDPYAFSMDKDCYVATYALASGSGFCISKAVLYAAVLRAIKIPSRLGFADVKNHLTSERLLKLMGTDIFYYHGYTEVYLDGRWFKATPAFNKELCEKAGTLPLEFDGESDSIFHSFSQDGSKHMEYIKDHGAFDDVPYDVIFNAHAGVYGTSFSDNFQASKNDSSFESEVTNVGK
ncbi:MAG: transglutaminase family protein [Pseudomonadales bacterium]|nr:transglutaminase family protein [Pseudomonadales bacterium]